MPTNVVETASARPRPSALQQRLATALLRMFVRKGRLRVDFSDGTSVMLGNDTGPEVGVTAFDLKTLAKVLLQGDLGFGETYMDEQWRITSGDLRDLVHIVYASGPNVFVDRGKFGQFILNLRRKLRSSFDSSNTVERSRRDVPFHYDLGNEFYESFLDPEMYYSCAFFSEGAQTLAEAQEHKARLIKERLGVNREGLNILELGCGWGGLSRYLARETGSSVTGITLAREQLQEAEERKQGLESSSRSLLNYYLQDYREHMPNRECVYDRIVSVGMFEHIGLAQYGTFFDTVSRLLKTDGIALIHTIVRPTPGITSRWINRYVFPGGYIASIDEILPWIHRAGLKTVASPFMHPGDDYVRTLDHWRKNFRANWNVSFEKRYGAKFFRLWELYLAASQNAFDPKQMNFQVAQFVLQKL